MLRIKKEEETRMKRVKGAWWCRKNERKALEAQCLGSEFIEAHGRYTGPFPSLAHDPTLHPQVALLILDKIMTKTGSFSMLTSKSM